MIHDIDEPAEVKPDDGGVSVDLDNIPFIDSAVTAGEIQTLIE